MVDPSSSRARHASRKLIPVKGPAFRARTRWIAGMVMLATAIVSVTAATPVARADRDSGAGKNFIANGTFQSGNSGWQAGKHTRLSSTTGYLSSRAMRISSTANFPTTVTLNDSDNSVKSTIARHVYRAAAWVRVEKPQQSVVIRLLQEDEKWRVVGHSQTYQWRAAPGWKYITTTYTALKGTSSSLDLNILAMQLEPSNSIVIDSVSLVDLSEPAQAPTPSPIPEPTAPTTTPPSSPTGTPAPPPSSTPRDVTTVPPSPAGWHLAWSDEFNGESLDRSNWNVENNSTYGEGNKELACLMDRQENVIVSGGLLTITARRAPTPIQCGTNDARFPQGRSYTSAMLTTKGKLNFGFGQYEIRAKMPTAQGTSKGLWPAFWMRPQEGGIGELDILEIIGTGKSDPYSANHVTQTIHYDYAPTYPKQGNGYDLPVGDFADGFHDFLIDWEPGSITWYVDGVETFRRDTATTSWLNSAFVNNFYLRLNMAVGGNWPGSPDADTAFPANYQVDYIRVYQR